jgi:hypothetical protein
MYVEISGTCPYAEEKIRTDIFGNSNTVKFIFRSINLLIFRCQSVICCRVTPLQKAQVVDLVKQNIKVKQICFLYRYVIYFSFRL